MQLGRQFQHLSGSGVSSRPVCAPHLAQWCVARETGIAPAPSWVARAASPEPPEQDDLDELRNKFFSGQAAPRSDSSSGSARPGTPGPSGAASLDSVNPYALGRQARKAFDEVWSQLSQLGSPTKSFVFDDTLEPGRDGEFQASQAAYTTVLVVGATGRVGRILLRKLLLRGYTVKALVRKRPDGKGEDYNSIPAAVEIVEGDLGEPADCQEAVRGVNKVIFCAGARSTFTGDLVRVDDRGVMNIVKALQDEYARVARQERSAAMAGEDTPEARRARRRLYSAKSKKEIADFSQLYHQLRWDVTWVGTPEEREATLQAVEAAKAAGQPVPGGMPTRPLTPGDRFVAASKAVAEINEEDHLIFEGALFQRGAYAEVGARLHPRLPGGEHRTAGTEAITMRVRGDGNAYTCVLQTVQGHSYMARFPTRAGFLNVRLPYSLFRADTRGAPPLNPKDIIGMAIRYEVRRSPPVAAGAARPAGVRPGGPEEGKFSLEVDWIKAIPGGEEPDVVLVSCARNAYSASLPEADAQRVVAAKRRGEDNLRLSGLGYTVIRPGQLVDEPGGYKTLVFDQGDRIEQAISAADVADICLRALHESSARNKTFDVCYDVSADDGSSMYELVTSVPDKSGSYLAQAAQALAKNT